MNSFKEYIRINEWKFDKEKKVKKTFNHFPKTKEELMGLIEERTSKNLLEPYLLDIDTSLIDTMTSIFSIQNNIKFRKIERLDLSTWNVSNVKFMNDMFNGCENLKYLNIKNWNTSNVSQMIAMFKHCESLEEIIGLDEINSNGYLNNVQFMNYMFEDCNEKVIPDWYDKTYWNAR